MTEEHLVQKEDTYEFRWNSTTKVSGKIMSQEDFFKNKIIYYKFGLLINTSGRVVISHEK